MYPEHLGAEPRMDEDCVRDMFRRADRTLLVSILQALIDEPPDRAKLTRLRQQRHDARRANRRRLTLRRTGKLRIVTRSDGYRIPLRSVQPKPCGHLPDSCHHLSIGQRRPR